MEDGEGTSQIAYVVSEYPTVSHTFILREVAALRSQGFDTLTTSVRATAPDQHRGPDERAEASRTFAILRAARNPATLARTFLWLLGRPRRTLGTLAHTVALRAPGLRAVLYQLVYFAEAAILARHLDRSGARHVHAHFANAGATVAMLAARLTGVPFSFTLHGPSDLREPERSRLDAKIEAARFVACISHFARSQAMLHSDPEHWDRLAIIHCGVAPDRYDGAPDPGSLPPAFVFVGRLAPAKGLRVLVEAFAAAHAAEEAITLTVVGDGPDRGWLAEAVRPFGNAVKLTGALSQDEVARILAGSRAMVLPSFAEGVPVVLMEAMASGRPVVATRITGVPELVEEGGSGLLVPPGDAGALAEAMLRLARNPELCTQMGAAGREKVRAEFTIDAEARRLAGLLGGGAVPAGGRA